MEALWCASHNPLPEQGEFILLSELDPELAKDLANTPKDAALLRRLAERLLNLAADNWLDIYQPGGSPAFQFILGQVAAQTRHNPELGIFYAHSVRDSRDEVQPDGSVRKVSTFRHGGWVRVYGTDPSNDGFEWDAAEQWEVDFCESYAESEALETVSDVEVDE